MYQNDPGPQFQKPGPGESRILRELLARSFAGRGAMLKQIETIAVSPIDKQGSLRLSTATPTPAAVINRIPAEASYLDADGVRVHVLLHVVGGYLDELEVYREDSGAVLIPVSEIGTLDFDMY